jgi:hypothetical protein
VSFLLINDQIRTILAAPFIACASIGMIPTDHNAAGTSSQTPIFANVTADSVVFGPASTFDEYGTEDPRVCMCM